LVLGALLLCSPTVHFWYLTCILPLAALRPSAAWTVLSLTIGITFLAYGNQVETGEWHFPAAALVLTWALPLLLLVRAAARFRARRRSGHWPTPRTVSAIVPTRNEAGHIRACMRSLAADPSLAEIIVVDSGSTDGTAGIAAGEGARVLDRAVPIELGGGRGCQVLAGLARAKGDVVAIVHADARVRPGSLTRVVELLARNPDVVGGAIGSVFAEKGVGFRLLEAANALRAGLFGLSFGDQIQFFRRHAVTESGPAPLPPLMEDVEISLRLQGLGRVVFLWGNGIVSARHWLAEGSRRAVLVARLLAGYLLARLLGTPDAVGMYRRYYTIGTTIRR
jgi:hypothetical protein